MKPYWKRWNGIDEVGNQVKNPVKLKKTVDQNR